MSKIDEIMSDVQSFASTWALVGGRFDDGSMHNTAEAQSAELRNLIAAALADARREGAEAMREAAQATPSGIDERGIPTVTVWQIRALPLPTGGRQAAEIERMRGALLWTLWHHQGGGSPVGQPIRRALGMGQFDPMTPEQVEHAKRFGEPE